jgi:hypothetical protein
MTSRNTSFEQLYKSYYPKLVAYALFFLRNDEAHNRGTGSIPNFK